MEQFFLQLLNNAITVSFLILAVLVIRLVFWKMPKRMICLLWIAVAMKLILPFSMESNFSLIPSAEPIPTDITLEKNPKVDSGLQGMDEIIHSAPQQLLAPPDVASTNPHQIYLYIGVILWIVGIGILTTYSMVTYMHLKRRVRMSVKMEEKVYECDDIADPFILGILRPRIYLPSTLVENAREYVLKHEITHLIRRDYLWKPLAFFIATIYWFQPLCWIAYVLFCRDIEYACDEKAISGESRDWKINYCETLMHCSVHEKIFSSCPVAFSENGVKDRIRHVVKYKKPALWSVLILIVISIVAVICFVTNPKKNASGLEQSEALQQNEIEISKVLTDKGADEKYQEYLRMHQAGKALSDALHGDTSDRDASNEDASNGDSSNNVVFATDTVEITYQELKVEITGIAETGKERDVVVKDAVKSVVTKKYLYAKAKQAGIHVTTDEYEAYKTALSTDIQNSENKEAVQAYFDGFGGEENYWKQMEATIMQNLTIHKYLNEQAANEKEIEEIKEEAYTEALTIDEEKELIRIANGIYE